MTRPQKWIGTIQAHLSQLMAYKLDFTMLILAPPMVFFLIKYNLWVSLYRITGTAALRGYDCAAMVEYQAYALVVSLFSQSYSGMRLSEDIRRGRISAFLLYPFEFWEYHLAGFLANELVQLFISLILLFLMWTLSWLHGVTLATLAAGFAFAALAGLFWFTIIFTLGLLSFWMEDTWILRIIFTSIAVFLSGGIVPLDLFPAPLHTVLTYLPFPYLTFVPVKIFSGNYEGSLPRAFFILFLWLVLAAIWSASTWRRGIRLYSAAGI